MGTAVASSVSQRVAAHWALLIVCVLFLLAGALTLGDYGVGYDEPYHRAVGNAALDFIAGDGARAFDQVVDYPSRYYGAVFHAPVVLTERLIGLDDNQDIYLNKHLFTHLFFLISGVFCYLLVLRLFNNRLLALVAMALFLLHPRIYANSFFNANDVPFLAMFMIALYLVHRAFRRETLGAFLLCGVGIGLLVNLRIMGIGLFAAVLALRALDLLVTSQPKGGRSRRATAGTTGAFALAAMLTYYASLPILWADPIGQFPESIAALRSHTYWTYELFRGEWRYSPDGPSFDHISVWVGITTSPAVLLLALGGGIVLAWRGVRRPRDLLHNTPLRFGFLLAVLPVATVVSVVVLDTNVYSGWRHLYFLYAPVLLLAVFGLHWLATAPRGRWPRAGTYTLAGLAIAVTLVSIVRIHPHQDKYFNALTDRTTPERLASRYGLNRWLSAQTLLADIAGDHPSGQVIGMLRDPQTRRILPADVLDRLILPDGSQWRDFRTGERIFLEIRDRPCPPQRAYVMRLYANTLHCVVDPVAHLGTARREALAREPVARARYDVYRDGRTLTHARDECSADDLAGLFLHVYPHDTAELPPWRVRDGHDFDNLDHVLRDGAARIDGNCVAVALLPDYPIARVRTGQIDLWSAEVPPDYAGARREALATEPQARGVFDVYHDGRTLTYVRDGCTEEDAAAPFFLHLYPLNADDLPDDRREHGFDNLDAALTRSVGARGGSCVAFVDLPEYPIASIRTGQHDGTRERWAVEFAPPE